MSDTIRLPRTGAPPLQFHGERVGEWRTGARDGAEKRFHIITLYRVSARVAPASAEWVAAIDYVSDWGKEPELHYALVGRDAHDITAQLAGFAASTEIGAGVVGFVPTGKHGELHAHIVQVLRNRFRLAVSTIIDAHFPEATETL